MTIYRMTDQAIEAVGETTFASVSVSERDDIQRLLKRQIEIISPDTLVIAEEFSDWEDSKRRIDLLGIDTDANLVVIELKRTEDGGHMELQAVRYAAMVSTLDFERCVRIFAAYLARESDDRDARATILKFLDWNAPDEDAFAQDVRMVLASAEFSREVTTAVIWLNDHGLDIRCVRIKPYGDKANLLLDVQQVIPLPEAQDYQVRLKEKQQKERTARKEKQGEPWNARDFYVSLGEGIDANWDDCRTFGFICGSGGKFYTRTLDHLAPGHRVFVNIPKRGFVGIGTVVEQNVMIDEFTVDHEGKTIPILEAPLKAADMSQNIGDRDLCSNIVRVEWLKVVSRDEAFWETGLFASQHIACKLRHSHTIERLCDHFGISNED
ncbi:MAG: hypothetical protein O3C17_17285 [Planctomycetota bacterium]|nr:hypothetical protein [Planctomycetota bacterium]